MPKLMGDGESRAPSPMPVVGKDRGHHPHQCKGVIFGGRSPLYGVKIVCRFTDGFWLAIPIPAAGKSTRGGRIARDEDAYLVIAAHRRDGFWLHWSRRSVTAELGDSLECSLLLAQRVIGDAELLPIK